MKYFFVIPSLFFLSLQMAFAQEPMLLRSITTNDGLSQNSVNQILLDSDGYLWFGTQDGLNRYNGYEFEIFRPDPDDSLSISDNFIIQMVEDPQGRLWISTRAGINVMNREEGVFHKIITKTHAYPQPYALKKHGDHIFFRGFPRSDDVQSLWAIDINYSFDHANSYVEDIGKVVDTEGFDFYQFFYDENELWLVGREGIKKSGSDTIYSLQAPVTVYSYQWQIKKLAENTFLLSEVNAGFVFNTKTKTITIIEELHPITYLEENSTRMLVGADDGLYRINTENWEVSGVETTPYELDNTIIHHLQKDQFGQIWIGTANKGVFVHYPDWTQFRYLEANNQIVWSSTHSNEAFWLGTDDGVFQCDNEVLVPKWLKGHKTTALRAIDDRIWMGTSEGLVFYSEKGGPLQKVSIPDLYFGATTEFLKTSSGDLFIGHHNALTQITKSGDTIDLGTKHDQDFYVIDLYEDRRKNVWIGSNFGCYYLDADGKLTYLPYEAKNPLSVNFNFVSGFAEDDQGMMWIATYGGGLSRLNEDSTFTHFTEKNGLGNNVIHGMVKDDRERLWLTTNDGLSVFNLNTQEFTNYTRDFGLRSPNFAMGSAEKFSDGQVAFGSVDGLLLFDPDRVRPYRQAPDLKWESIAIDYQEVMTKEADQLKLIEIFPGDQVFSLTFAALKYESTPDVIYHHQLEGFDDEWVPIDARTRTITYSSLPYEAFNLRVRASSVNNHFEPTYRSIQVVVHPPFYLKTWFILLAGLILIGSISLLVYYFSRRKLKRKLEILETKQKIQQERERISRDLHDSVGTHFAYIISRLDFLYLGWTKENIPDKKAYLGHLSEFARSGMKMLRETIWALNKEEVNAISLRHKIDDYLKLCLNGHDIRYQLHFDSEVPQINSTLALNSFRVIQEAVSNSIKHAQADQIKIEWMMDEKQMKLIVSDNGVGFDVDEKKQMNGHYGLGNLEKRAKEMDAEIKITSGANGTSVIIET